MQKHRHSNNWQIKRGTRKQMIITNEQRMLSSLYLERLAEIQTQVNTAQKKMEKAVTQIETVIVENGKKNVIELENKLNTLIDDMEQTQELIKILVANQLIDEIK